MQKIQMKVSSQSQEAVAKEKEENDFSHYSR